MNMRRAKQLSGAGIVVALAVAAALLLRDRSDPEAVATADAKTAATIVLEDRTLSFGATAEHRQGDDHLTGLDESLGSGACAVDYDNDGWVDLFAVNGSGDTRYYGHRHWWQRGAGHTLLRNVGDGRFEDVSANALPQRPTRGFGCVAADFDNDGNTDIFVTGLDENLLLRNLGNGKFLDVTSTVKGYGWQTAVSAGDFDEDGLLDLYVGRLVQYQKGAHTFEPGSQYKQDVSSSFNASLYPAQPNSLYRNRGELRFEDIAERAGVANPDGRTLGVTWFDIDVDERPDLIVANAAGTGSTGAYYNRGKGRFAALGAETRLQMASGARGIAWGDLDNDSKPEIVVTAVNGAQSAIFVKSGASSFTDRARQLGFARDAYSGLSPWGAALADVNNDGYLDLFVANGLAIPDPDVPHLTVGQHKQLWLGSPSGALQPATFGAMSPMMDRQSARGVVTADFDNDGDVDFYVTHNNDLGQLLMNETPRGRHWLGVKLIDSEGNRDAVGARIAVTTTNGTQYRWIARGAGFLSDHDPRAHFGLGSAAKVRRVQVTWPDGDTSTYRNVAVDSYVVLERDRSVRPYDARVISPQGNLATLAQAQEPRLRADYLRLVAAARGIEQAMPQIALAAHDSDAAVRRAALEVLEKQPSAAALAILLDLMADSDVAIAEAAVHAVCKYESEEAARWMLRMFAHPSASIRTAVADCFAFYFQEEEAVVHRKYLAVPYLVERLDDESAATQIASIRALGNAERFRGAPALVELARRTELPAIRAEAIRAIGLIRDKHVTADLLALLAQRNVQAEPATMAQLFVALRRLDQPALLQLLRDFGAARASFAGLPKRARLATWRELIVADEGVVLGKPLIAELAQGTFGSLVAAKSVAATQDMLLLIEILRGGAQSRSIALLKSMATRVEDPQIAAAALNALIFIDPIQASRYAGQALAAENDAIGVGALSNLGNLRLDIAKDTIERALTRTKHQAVLLNVLRRIPDQTNAQAILRIATDNAAPIEARAAALRALARSPFKLQLPSEAYNEKHEEVALALVKYEFSKLPDLVVARSAPPSVDRLLKVKSTVVRRVVVDCLAMRSEFWAKTKILAVLKESDDPALRQHILALLERDALQGSRMLEAIAMDKADPLRIDALRRLEGRQGTSAEQLLMAVLRDPNESPQVRIVAAHRLTERLGADVLRLLQTS